jgi:hypothetical protein
MVAGATAGWFVGAGLVGRFNGGLAEARPDRFVGRAAVGASIAFSSTAAVMGGSTGLALSDACNAAGTGAVGWLAGTRRMYAVAMLAAATRAAEAM